MPNSNENKSHKLYVGQTLYRDAGYFNGKPQISEEKITSIGNKYFYVEGWLAGNKFDKKTLTHKSIVNSHHDIMLYFDTNEIVEKYERNLYLVEIRNQIHRYYDKSVISIEQLRKVAEILGIDKFDK
jgi:hypothetical protein